MRRLRPVVFFLLILIFLTPLACVESPKILRHPDNPEPPSIDKWNWKIETYSRIYYVLSYDDLGDEIKLNGFYSVKDGKYVWFDDELVLNKKDFGVKVKRGPEYQIK